MANNSNGIDFKIGTRTDNRAELNVHPVIKKHLEEINELFNKKLFFYNNDEISVAKVKSILNRTLTSKNIDKPFWKRGSILDYLANIEEYTREDLNASKIQLEDEAETVREKLSGNEKKIRKYEDEIRLINEQIEDVNELIRNENGKPEDNQELKKLNRRKAALEKDLKSANNNKDEVEIIERKLEEEYDAVKEKILRVEIGIEKISGTWEDLDFKSFGAIVAAESTLSELYFELMRSIDSIYNSLDFNLKVLFAIDKGDFENSGIVSYMVCSAYFLRNITTGDSLMNYVRQKNRYPELRGTFINIYDYLTVSSSRKIIKNKNLSFKHSELDSFSIYKLLTEKDKEVSFLDSLYTSRLDKLIYEYRESGQYREVIRAWNTGGMIPEIEENEELSVVQMLRRLNKNEDDKVDIDKLKKFLPTILYQLKNNPSSIYISDSASSDLITSDEDFEVDFFTDDQSVNEINISNIKCSAQLFYSMTIGDELEVFNVVNFLTHKYLVRGGMEIKDRKLREHLQMYVFNNKFIDSRTSREMDKTRLAERQMFYKQVFNYGNTAITDDVIVNNEFTKLWKVLIVESARYLERAQESPNPMNFVSKQNVIQTIEDLQYNLSTHCAGMVNVITPAIYQELNFVIQKILNHDEIRRQIVPSGGSWSRVVENLYATMRSRRMKTTVIVNKAKCGHDIIRAIADYNPSTFENDRVFSGFISLVDNFITTQSILQESMVDQVKRLDRDNQETEDHSEKIASNGHVPVAAGNDEWDF